MVHLTRRDLDPRTQLELNSLQDSLDQLASYDLRVAEVEQRWTNESKRVAFNPLKISLKSMCPGVERCMLCLDSAGSDIEHFRPKKTFPSSAFRWPNMFYICTTCNRSKLERFPLRDQAGNILERPKGFIGQNPILEQADAVLINPVDDDPRQYLMLDIAGNTFRVIPRLELAGYELERALQTIDILGLNRRDLLPRARRAAFAQFRLHLELAIQKHQSRDSAGVQEVAAAIRTIGHQMVWKEMQHQRTSVPSLSQLFAQLPNDVLTW